MSTDTAAITVDQLEVRFNNWDGHDNPVCTQCGHVCDYDIGYHVYLKGEVLPVCPVCLRRDTSEPWYRKVRAFNVCDLLNAAGCVLGNEDLPDEQRVAVERARDSLHEWLGIH